MQQALIALGRFGQTFSADPFSYWHDEWNASGGGGGRFDVVRELSEISADCYFASGWGIVAPMQLIFV